MFFISVFNFCKCLEKQTERLFRIQFTSNILHILQVEGRRRNFFRIAMETIVLNLKMVLKTEKKLFRHFDKTFLGTDYKDWNSLKFILLLTSFRLRVRCTNVYGCTNVYASFLKTTVVVIVWADQRRGVGDPPCIKIGYSSRLVPRAEKGPQPMY